MVWCFLLALCILSIKYDSRNIGFIYSESQKISVHPKDKIRDETSFEVQSISEEKNFCSRINDPRNLVLRYLKIDNDYKNSKIETKQYTVEVSEESIQAEIENERLHSNQQAAQKLYETVSRKAEKGTYILQLGLSPSIMMSPLAKTVYALELNYDTCERFRNGIYGKCAISMGMELLCPGENSKDKDPDIEGYYKNIDKVAKSMPIPIFDLIFIHDQTPISSLIKVYQYSDISTSIVVNRLLSYNEISKIKDYYKIQLKVSKHSESSNTISYTLLRPKFSTLPDEFLWRDYANWSTKTEEQSLYSEFIPQFISLIKSLVKGSKIEKEKQLQVLSDLRILKEHMTSKDNADKQESKQIRNLMDLLNQNQIDEVFDYILDEIRTTASEIIQNYRENGRFSKYFIKFENGKDFISDLETKLNYIRTIDELRAKTENLNKEEISNKRFMVLFEDLEDCQSFDQNTNWIRIAQILRLAIESLTMESSVEKFKELTKSMCDNSSDHVEL